MTPAKHPRPGINTRTHKGERWECDVIASHMTSSVVGSVCVLWGGLGGDGGYVERAQYLRLDTCRARNGDLDVGVRVGFHKTVLMKIFSYNFLLDSLRVLALCLDGGSRKHENCCRGLHFFRRKADLVLEKLLKTLGCLVSSTKIHHSRLGGAPVMIAGEAEMLLKFADVFKSTAGLSTLTVLVTQIFLQVRVLLSVVQ